MLFAIVFAFAAAFPFPPYYSNGFGVQSLTAGDFGPAAFGGAGSGSLRDARQDRGKCVKSVCNLDREKNL